MRLCNKNSFTCCCFLLSRVPWERGESLFALLRSLCILYLSKPLSQGIKLVSHILESFYLPLLCKDSRPVYPWEINRWVIRHCNFKQVAWQMYLENIYFVAYSRRTFFKTMISCYRVRISALYYVTVHLHFPIFIWL